MTSSKIIFNKIENVRKKNNKNKLPSYKVLKQIPGIALLEKPLQQNININHKDSLVDKNLAL